MEIGASAGVNLRPDILPGFAHHEVGSLPAIVERRGCDLNPIDATTPRGRAHLLSFVWVDDIEGFARLDRAITAVRGIPATVERADATTFLRSLGPCPGTTTVVWHSALMPYLDPDVRAQTLEAITQLGRRATTQGPVVHLSWEFDADRAQETLLLMRSWHGTPNPSTEVVFRLAAGHPWPPTDPTAAAATIVGSS
jgi:hypothetical protein